MFGEKLNNTGEPECRECHGKIDKPLQIDSFVPIYYLNAPRERICDKYHGKVDKPIEGGSSILYIRSM